MLPLVRVGVVAKSGSSAGNFIGGDRRINTQLS